MNDFFKERKIVIELKESDVHQVSGAALFNVIGGLAGAVGGFYGSIIVGGQNADGWSIAAGTASGFAAGFINPIRDIGGAVSSAGGGILAASVVSVMDDIEFYRSREN